MSESIFKSRIKNLPEKHVKKGEILLRAGDPTKSGYYVESGCLRSYIIDSKGKEHIYQFAPEDWIVSDEEAIIEKKPAILYIDAIEDSVIKVFNSLTDLGTETLDSETAKKIITTLHKKNNSFRKRILLLLSATAEERYETFIKTYPNLAQRVPLKMLASYLGITPESLSRVRKEILAKK